MLYLRALYQSFAYREFWPLFDICDLAHYGIDSSKHRKLLWRIAAWRVTAPFINAYYAAREYPRG